MALLSDIFGGPTAGLLTPEEQSQAGQRALRDFGISLLMSGQAPSPQQDAPSFLSAIAMGTRAGQQSYDDFVSATRATKTAADIEEILKGGFSLKNLQDAYNRAVQGGDLASAQTLTQPLVQAMSAGDGTLPNLQRVERDNGDIVFFNPKTGAEVYTWQPPEGTDKKDLTAEDMRIIQAQYGQFDSRTRIMREVPLQVARVFAPTNRLILSFENENVSDEKKEELAFSAVSAISAYARTIDPGSVVRSEEMQLLLGQGDLRTKIESFLQQKIDGRMAYQLAKALQAEARAQLLAQAPVYMQEKALDEGRMTDFGFEAGEFRFPDPYTPLMQQMFDASGRTRQYNAIGLTPDEVRMYARPDVREQLLNELGEDPSRPRVNPLLRPSGG